MIYYFSGTHNSRYVALRLSSEVGQSVRFIPRTVPALETVVRGEDSSVGFVFPVYAWGVPPVVLDFIARLPDSFFDAVREGAVPVWCVVTCGDECGNAVEMLRKVLSRRGVELAGAWSIFMPNVFVLLPGFGVDSVLDAGNKILAAVRRVAEIGGGIKAGDWQVEVHRGSWPRLRTALVYPLFRRWNLTEWHHTDDCAVCGKCAGVCPVGNIVMEEDGPKWGTGCTACCACFHICQKKSAQYGKLTSGKGQYFFSLPRQ